MTQRPESSTGVTARGDLLLGLVLSQGDEDAAVELLDEFFAGYPIDRLRLLLASDNENAARSGAWLAAELGEKAEPLLEDIAAGLAHPAKYVRFHLLDSLLLAVPSDRGDIIAEGIKLISDREEAVRWKAMEFIAKLDIEQLAASVPFLRDTDLSEEIEWLTCCDTEGTLARLSGEEQVRRRIAAAAAARLAVKGNRAVLRRAAASDDAEVATFARDISEELSVGPVE